MANMSEIAVYIDEVFDKVLDEMDSGDDYDYILASKEYEDAEDEHERSAAKLKMDLAAAKLIESYNQLQDKVLYASRAVDEIFGAMESYEPFDFQNFKMINGKIERN